jgi:hypothetical protein
VDRPATRVAANPLIAHQLTPGVEHGLIRAKDVVGLRDAGELQHLHSCFLPPIVMGLERGHALYLQACDLAQGAADVLGHLDGRER